MSTSVYNLTWISGTSNSGWYGLRMVCNLLSAMFNLIGPFYTNPMQKPPETGHRCSVPFEILHIDMCTVESSKQGHLHIQDSLL